MLVMHQLQNLGALEIRVSTEMLQISVHEVVRAHLAVGCWKARAGLAGMLRAGSSSSRQQAAAVGAAGEATASCHMVAAARRGEASVGCSVEAAG